MRDFPRRQKSSLLRNQRLGAVDGVSVSGAELWAGLLLVEARCQGASGMGIAHGLGVSRMVTSENRTPLPRKHTWGSAARLVCCPPAG